MTTVAQQQKIAGDLNWNQRQLATLDIELLADDPEETAQQVCDAAVRYYQVVLEYARTTATETSLLVETPAFGSGDSG